MSHTIVRQHQTSHALLSVLSQCVLLACIGCSGSGESESNDETAAEVNQSLTGSRVIIYYADRRRASNVVVTVEGDDQATGSHYSDWEDVGGYLPGPAVRPRKWSAMVWSNGPGNRLDESYFVNNPLSDPYSLVSIDDWSSGRFTNMRVTVRANINGSCHEDWEDVDWTTRPILYFDGNGGNWDNGCYRGDLLRPNP
jgi:hypothetical protein